MDVTSQKQQVSLCALEAMGKVSFVLFQPLHLLLEGRHLANSGKRAVDATCAAGSGLLAAQR